MHYIFLPKFCFLCISDAFIPQNIWLKGNSVDPDQSDLGLHNLQVPFYQQAEVHILGHLLYE